jgi:hypothetical protein
MGRLEMLHECDHELSALLPDLPRPEQKALAALVTGVVGEQASTLSRAGAAAPGPAADRSKQRRAQRLLANDRLAVAVAQRALIRRVLRGRRGRLDLLLDATTAGATATDPGTVTLVVAAGWHGRALPLVWRTWRTDEPDQDWAGAIRAMLAVIAAELPPGVVPVLMADRGLSGAPLAEAVRERGWHLLVRVQKQTRLRLADGSVRPIGELAPEPGRERLVADARAYAPRSKPNGRWVSDWEAAPALNAVAVWRPGDPEPWLLLTDLPAARRRCADYRRRTWEEELFRDLKGFGWGWDKSRVRVPARVERLVLVLALATLWMLAVGQRVLRRGLRPRLEDRCRRCYSHFQLGLRWLKRRTANDEHVPCLFHLWAEPPRKLS